MKNIYEDGTFSAEGVKKDTASDGFEDVSSVKKNVPPVHATRPNRQPPLPPMSQQASAPAQQSVPGYMPYPNVQYIPYAPYPVDQQGQPIQPQGAVYGAPYAPYPPYQQGYYPTYTQAPQSAPAVSVPENSDAPDPGTRVLYQSADFDKPKRTDVLGKGEKYIPDGYVEDEVAEEIDAEDEQEISIEEVRLESKKKVPVKPTIVQSNQPDGVFVDDMEMSTFEFSAMAQKRNSTARVIHQPGAKKPVIQKGIQVEEIEDEPLQSDGVFLGFPDDDDDEAADEKKAVQSNKNGKKKLPKSEIIRRVVLGVSLLAIVIASGMLLNEYRLSKENEKTMDEVSGLIVEEATTSDSKTTTKKKGENEKPKQEQEKKPLTPEQQWAEIKSEYPNVIFPANLQLKYAKLYATNRDFVGYLSADGVNLNLPIVQTKDDEYYLKKNFYGKSTKYGCPFVTHLNNIDPLDQNTVIFGHHMNDGTVFGALDKYKTIDGFKSAPIITFNTMFKDYKWKVIAAFITNAYEKQDNGYVFRYYFTSLSTEERYSAYLSELAQRSLYDTGVDVLPSDKILTLSTCSHEFEEARFVVVARLVRDGEIAEVDTMRATVNPNPRYPQAYYDKKGKTNPYKNASRWEVG